MAKIYRTTDRIPLKVGELKITISPLSIHQKAAVEDAVDGSSSGFLKAATRAIKFAVKSVEGLEDSSGDGYNLEFDMNGELTDACVDDLFNIEESPKLAAIALNLINNIPDQFYDATTGLPLEGVEFITDKKKEKSTGKKNKASGV